MMKFELIQIRVKLFTILRKSNGPKLFRIQTLLLQENILLFLIFYIIDIGIIFIICDYSVSIYELSITRNIRWWIFITYMINRITLNKLLVELPLIWAMLVNLLTNLRDIILFMKVHIFKTLCDIMFIRNLLRLVNFHLIYFFLELFFTKHLFLFLLNLFNLLSNIYVNVWLWLRFTISHIKSALVAFLSYLIFWKWINVLFVWWIRSMEVKVRVITTQWIKLLLFLFFLVYYLFNLWVLIISKWESLSTLKILRQKSSLGSF